MLESNINEGNQPITDDLADLKYGVSLLINAGLGANGRGSESSRRNSHKTSLEIRSPSSRTRLSLSIFFKSILELHNDTGPKLKKCRARYQRKTSYCRHYSCPKPICRGGSTLYKIV